MISDCLSPFYYIEWINHSFVVNTDLFFQCHFCRWRLCPISWRHWWSRTSLAGSSSCVEPSVCRSSSSDWTSLELRTWWAQNSRFLSLYKSSLFEFSFQMPPKRKRQIIPGFKLMTFRLVFSCQGFKSLWLIALVDSGQYSGGPKRGHDNHYCNHQ